MKKIFPLVAVLWIVIGCNRKTPEPSPEHPLLMSVRASYENEKVIIESIGSVFASTAGPIPVDFDKTEVWLAEGSSSNLKLLQTTDQKRIELTNLQSDKIYSVAVKGSKGTYWSELSSPVMVVPNKLKPIKELLKTTNTVSFYLSPTGNYTLVQSQDAKDITLTQLATNKVQKLTYPSSIFFRNWVGNGEQIIFEASSSQRRSYVIYDIAKAAFSEFALPAGANVWLAALSPDGKKIAYTDYKRTGNVWVYDTDTKIDKRTALAQPYDLAWTSDSRSLLVHRYRSSSQGAQEIVQFDPQNDVVTKTLFVTPANGSIQWPRLSVSGDKLLFSATLSGQPHIWLYDLQTEKLRPVTKGTYQFGWLSESEFYAIEEGTAPQVFLYQE
ncbi:WD40 repeat domain-containing protein [Runella sp.]|jgi:Tol biopolymer transport system component|uniref:WD40 repeat domain-containing protein n=1 Tax=Runella sp. TaxID=1960881 RepID=UPI002621471E|nr:WD40 repeat domain-containing protein [Runella sp.]